MKKGMIVILIFLGLFALFFFGSTLRCKSLAKNAAGRIGYSISSGCYIELSGSKVPLK
jgi:hypothetical protein